MAGFFHRRSVALRLRHRVHLASDSVLQSTPMFRGCSGLSETALQTLVLKSQAFWLAADNGWFTRAVRLLSLYSFHVQHRRLGVRRSEILRKPPEEFFRVVVHGSRPCSSSPTGSQPFPPPGRSTESGTSQRRPEVRSVRQQRQRSDLGNLQVAPPPANVRSVGALRLPHPGQC